MNNSLEMKMAVVFGFAVAYISSIAWVSYRSAIQFTMDATWASHTHEVLADIRAVHSDLSDVESGAHGYALTGLEGFLTPYRAGLADQDGLLKRLRELTADNPSQQRRLDVLMELVSERRRLLNEVIEARRDRGLDGARELVAAKGDELQTRIRQLLEDMTREERGLLPAREARMLVSMCFVLRFMVFGGVVAVLYLTGALVLVLRDLKLRRRLTRDHEENEQTILFLLNSMAGGIYGIDLRGECTLANHACLSLLAYDDARELLGKNMHGLVHHTRPDGSPYGQEECPISAVLRSGSRVHVDDEVFWRKDGTRFSVEYWSLPLFRGGHRIGAVVTFLDITGRKLAEAAVRESEQRLELATRSAGTSRSSGGSRGGPGRLVCRARSAVRGAESSRPSPRRS
jgi:PAS domain S-box-containing protein